MVLLTAKSRGFTLVELIVTLTILAIVSVGIFGFIESGAAGYVASRNREALQSGARFAVERVVRELRHAVPNSLGTDATGRCLTFTPIHYSGSYRQLIDGEATLDVAIASQDTSWQTKVSDGKHRLVFMPTSPGDLTGSQSLLITGVSGNTITTAKTTAAWPAESPSKRFYIYRDPVQFCFKNNQLVRVSHGGSQEAVLASGLAAGSHFSLGTASLSRGNLVTITYRFSQSGESSVYHQQVQVLNAP